MLLVALLSAALAAPGAPPAAAPLVPPKNSIPGEPVSAFVMGAEEDSDEDMAPLPAEVGTEVMVQLPGASPGSMGVFIKKAQPCENSMRAVMSWVNEELRIPFTPSEAGQYKLCYQDTHHPMLIEYSSVTLDVNEGFKPNNGLPPIVQLAGSDDPSHALNLVWWDKTTERWPARGNVKNLWFSSEGMGREVVDQELDAEKQQYWNNSIVVAKAEVGNNIGRVEQYFKNKPEGTRMGIFQIGDFENNPRKHSVYQYADAVFRIHYFQISDKVHYIPHGKADGFKLPQQLMDMGSRPNLCAFMGWDVDHKAWAKNPNKDDRHRMADALKDGPCQIKLVHGWNDKHNLNEYIDLLSKSKFALIPNGIGPETFRLYEAIEMGCVPVMTKDAKEEYLAAHPDIPWVVVNSWEEAPSILEMKQHEAPQLAKKSLDFWEELKSKKQREIRDVVDSTIM